MKRKKLFIIATIGAAFLSVVLGVGAALDPRTSLPAEPAPAASQPAAPVRVAPVQRMTLPLTAAYSGTLEPWERAHVSAQSGQRIQRVHVREGDRVQRGQLVAEMDATNLTQAEVELRTARNDLERTRQLVDIGAIPRQQYEQAEAQYETAAANVEMLRDNTHLLSPITGVVTAKHFVDGEQFAVSADAPSIVTVQTLDPLRVVINVSERKFPVIREGMSAVVELDTYAERLFAGTVERITPVISPDTRTFRVEIRIDNPERRLTPGMFARVSLQLGEVGGLFVPRTALRTQPGSQITYVYVAEDGHARRVEVAAGERVDEHQQVVAGLAEDALVVIEGAARLADGMPLRTVE